MNLTQKQLQTKTKIEEVAKLFNIDPIWAVSVAMTESSLGINQISRTGCKGVFQMSSIAMKDLLEQMPNQDDELTDIVCGVAFLNLLLKRWKTIDKVTSHYCDPKEIDAYMAIVHTYMRKFSEAQNSGGTN